MRLGYRTGDQWEPAIAADGHGHIYVLYPQYGAVPDCAACTAPTIALLISNDNGLSWQPSKALLPFPTGQFDPQIVVDPADRQTVYASWLQNEKRDIVVARSLDFGRTAAGKTPTSRCWRFAEPMFMPGSITKVNSSSRPRMTPDRRSAWSG